MYQAPATFSALLLLSSVTWTSSLNSPSFLLFQMRTIGAFLIGLLWGLNEVTHVRHSEQCLTFIIIFIVITTIVICVVTIIDKSLLYSVYKLAVGRLLGKKQVYQ